MWANDISSLDVSQGDMGDLQVISQDGWCTMSGTALTS